MDIAFKYFGRNQKYCSDFMPVCKGDNVAPLVGSSERGEGVYRTHLVFQWFMKNSRGLRLDKDPRDITNHVPSGKGTPESFYVSKGGNVIPGLFH